jgi:hypothetical protein
MFARRPKPLRRMRRAKLLVADLSVAVAIERHKCRCSIFYLFTIEPMVAV